METGSGHYIAQQSVNSSVFVLLLLDVKSSYSSCSGQLNGIRVPAFQKMKFILALFSPNYFHLFSSRNTKHNFSDRYKN